MMNSISSKIVRPLAFFDLEATGVDPLKDRIVQICVVIVQPNGQKEIKTRLINPTIPIPEKSTEIHKIKNEDVKDAPTFAQIAKGLFDHLNGCDFAGYNSNRYDVPLLAKEFERAGVTDPFEDCIFLDVFQLFSFFFPRTLSAAFTKYTGKELEDAHDAEIDVVATLEIFESMIQKHDDELSGNLEEIAKVGINFRPVDLFNKIILNDDDEPVFNFGKYKGESVLKSSKDVNYFDWLLNKAELPENTKRVISKIINE